MTTGNGTTNQNSNTLAAIFMTEHDAREAIKQLHKAGFRTTWMGTTREIDRDTGEPTVAPDSGLARFLSAGSGRRPLHHVLIEHGLSEPQAQAIEADVAPGCSIVTAYAEDDPERVADLMYAQRGQVIGGVDNAPRTRTSYVGPERRATPRDGRVDPRDTMPTERGELEYSTMDDFEVEEFHLADRIIPRY